MAGPVLGALLVVLAVILVYIGGTQIASCGAGYSFLYWAAADAAGASALMLFRRPIEAGVCAAGFLVLLGIGLFLTHGAGCTI